MTLLDRASWPTRLLVLVGLFAGYVLAGRFGLSLAIVHPSASAVWPPILAGAFVVNVTTGSAATTATIIAVGNTLEAVIGARLISRWAAGRLAFGRTRNVLRFILAAGLATALAAVNGTAALLLAGSAAANTAGAIWLTWWLGDLGGALVVAPVLLLWSTLSTAKQTTQRLIDATVLAVGLGLVGWLVFGQPVGQGFGAYPLEFFCIPVVLWVAFRFGARATATVTLLLSAMAVTATYHGRGPFVLDTVSESLLLVQAFIVVVAAMGLTVAAAVAERQRAETHQRELAVTDPLTGLANYRQLMLVLESELRRSQRTGRTFALLLLDMDGLKQINDRFGHLIGSQALFRLGQALRQCCRAVDTPGRFGGDEFGIVLPEADGSAARLLAQRIDERLARQPDRPRITVSVGIARFPRDAQSADALIAYADRELYKMKRQAAAPSTDPLPDPPGRHLPK